MTEDIAAALDALQVKKGPEKVTCLWWREQPQEVREATMRAVQRVGHTAVTRLLRDKGIRVTPPEIKNHVEGRCDKCR